MSHTILIVDDSCVVRHALRSCIEHTHPDVVILDLQMPVMDGLEAAGQINVISPNTTMLMFTMHNSEQLLKIAPAAGIKEVLSKSDKLAEHLLASLKRLQVEREDHLSMRTSSR